MAISDQLADHIVSMRYDDLPASAIDAARRLIIDTIGTGYAGASEPGCGEIADMVLVDGAAPRSTLWSTGQRTSAMGAALANGTFAAALDYDSLHFDGVIHPEIVTLPAALALGEREKRSGRDLIRAIVIGGDLMCRMAMSTGRNAAWFVTSTNGTFGAAAAASIMLGLDREQTRNALGLALCQAGGTIQAVLERTLAKRMQSAFASHSGMRAAELARRGVTGPVDAFEGPAGYYAAFEPGDAAALLDGLGQRYETLNTGIKKFPSCACNHAAIQASIELARDYDIVADELKRVHVKITPYMQQVVGGDFDPRGDLQVAAQFSVRYSVACALMRRELRLGDLMPERVLEPKVRALADRIEIELDGDNDGFLSPATVTVETAAGRVQRTVQAVPGSTQAPLSDGDVADKFYDCLSYGVAKGQPAIDGARLFANLSALETVADLNAMMAAVFQSPQKQTSSSTSVA